MSSWTPNSIDATGLTKEQVREIETHIRGLKDGAETYPAPRHGWTCFHCGETFRSYEGAKLHFGSPSDKRPKCSVEGDA